MAATSVFAHSLRRCRRPISAVLFVSVLVAGAVAAAQASSFAYRCPVTAGEVTSAAGRSMSPISLPAATSATACSFGAKGATVSYRILFRSIPLASVAASEAMSARVQSGVHVFRAGFARNGVAEYPVPTSGGDSAFALFFDGSRSRAWKVVITVRGSGVTQASLVATMTALRKLKVW